MTWPSKDPADYRLHEGAPPPPLPRRTRPGRALVATLLLLVLAATLVANAVAVGDTTVAPALTAALAAVLLVRYRTTRSRHRP